MRIGRAGALLLVALLCLGGVAGCGGGSDGDTTHEDLPASPSGKVEAASFDGVHSGEIELALEIDRYKKHPEEVNLRILGSFIRTGSEKLPQLDVAIQSNGDLAGHHIEFLAGPLLRAEKWIVNFDGKVYEVDQTTFKELKSKLEEAQGEPGGEGNAMACVEAAEGFDITEAVHHVSYEGKGETLDGVKIETLGADLDAGAVIEELIEMAEGSPGCKAQLEAVGVPPAAQLEELAKELEGSLTAAHLTLSLDKHGVARYFEILANVELPRNEELEVELVMRLSRVNEVTELPNTHGYSPYSELLKELGLDNQDLKRAGAGEIYVSVLAVLADGLFGREAG